MRTMTDNEFQRLKGLLHKKIIEVDALRKLYREQTGRDYVVGRIDTKLNQTIGYMRAIKNS